MRYVLECTQGIICCHRELITRREAGLYSKISTVKFTDHTIMSVNVRLAKYRERVEEIKGYSSLFDNIIKQGLTGFVKIEDLRE